MVLPNPLYINQAARHSSSVIRLLTYAALVGQEGVLGNSHLAIKALGTPGAAIQAMPGGYGILARHLGGEYEAYAGKFSTAEQVAVSPTTSSGGRTDLVIARIENPYVSGDAGSGQWLVPTNAVEGPYAYIRVIENVPSTTFKVSTVDNWSAIPLAKIVRPANTGIVQQSHIVELRSLAQLGGTRTIIVDAPPAAQPPPVAQTSYCQFKFSAADPNYGKPTGGSDNVHDYFNADTVARTWPTVASFDVPVPEWAVECDAEAQVMNAQILTNDVYGKMWLDFGGTATAPGTYAIDYNQVPGRHTIPYGATFTVPKSLRGRYINVKVKFQSYYSAPGKLDAKGGTVTKLALNFQRVADPT